MSVRIHSDSQQVIAKVGPRLHKALGVWPLTIGWLFSKLLCLVRSLEARANIVAKVQGLAPVSPLGL